MNTMIRRYGFNSRDQFIAFLTVVFSGQIIYSAFESFKIPFYQRLVDYYHLTDTQFGIVFMMLGTAIFFYIPGGWVNNRFHVRDVLTWGLIYRLLTSLFMILVRPSFPIMVVITLTWGILDAIYWPAVVKGVVLFSGKGNKSTGLGALTGIRAGGEALLNGILLAAVGYLSGAALVFKTGMIIYACLSIPLVICIRRYVPRDPVDDNEYDQDAKSSSDAHPASTREALAGLIVALKHPRIWLAGLAGMTMYWVYMFLVYTTPFFTRVYGMDQDFAGIYATINAVVLGLTGAIVGGLVADRIVKSAALTLAITLAISALCLIVLTWIPTGREHTISVIIVMSVLVFAIMMAKGIQQAPVAELDIPQKIMGAAMSVNSFMCFASILWAMPINGMLLDASKNNPAHAFHSIFYLLCGVAIFGAICAGILEVLNRRHRKEVEHSL